MARQFWKCIDWTMRPASRLDAQPREPRQSEGT
jgi:hypothetical protein